MHECLTARDKTGTGSSSTSQTAQWSGGAELFSLCRFGAQLGSFWQLLAAWDGANRHKKLVRLGEKRPGWGTIGKRRFKPMLGLLQISILHISPCQRIEPSIKQSARHDSVQLRTESA